MNRIFILLGVSTLLCACSNIEPEDRLLEVPPLAESLIQRNILIEDFTGQNCPNCPTATEVIEQMEHNYGEHVVSVGIHSGGLGKGTPLYTEFGQYCFELLGDAQLPQPVVRVGRTAEMLIGGPAVQNGLHTLVRRELQRTTPISITGSVTTENTDLYKLRLQVCSREDMEATLQVWVVEDSVVSTQSMPDGSKERRYNHMSVLRASLTPNEGTPLSLSALQSEETTLELSLAGQRWKAEHLALIAIVSRPGGEVLQVERLKVE